MNRKIPFQDLSARIATATGISNESAEQFVKNFFELLSDSLIKGEAVKIKGLGSFSVVDNGTEKTIEFVPDKEVADSINAPFAMFEPVKLNDAVSDSMLSEIESNEEAETDLETAMDESEAPIVENAPTDEKPAETEVTSEEEPSSAENTEIKTPEAENVPQEQTENASEPQEETEEETVEKTVEEPVKAEEKPVGTETEAPASVVTTTPLPLPVSAPEPAPAAIPDPTPKPAYRQTLNPPAIRPLEEEPEEYIDRKNSKSSTGGNFWIGLAIGAIVGLALGACAVYLAIDHLFPTSQQAEIEETEMEIVAAEPPSVTLDSVAPVEDAEVEEAAAVSQTVETAETKEQPKAEPVAEPQKAEAKVVKDTVRSGYLIINMAKKYYGSKDFWVYIYEENKAKIGNPNRLQPGVELIIPPAEKYGIDAKNPESINQAKKKATEILKKYPR